MKKTQKDWKFKMLDVVKDEITGFEGVVVAVSELDTGAIHYGVQSQKLKDGKPEKWQWVDETRLKKTMAISANTQKTWNLDFEIHDYVKDTLTGFSGFVVDITFYQTGCINIGVQSNKLDRDGKPLDTQFFTSNRVVLLDKNNTQQQKEEKPKKKRIVSHSAMCWWVISPMGVANRV